MESEAVFTVQASGASSVSAVNVQMHSEVVQRVLSGMAVWQQCIVRVMERCSKGFPELGEELWFEWCEQR